MQDLQRLLGGSGGGGGAGGGGGERRLKSHNQQALKCPRCESLNTKFCYYNNYNLSQPRFFCKGCRRYWTNGGVLRTVPVGGGCRKTKRSKQKTGNENSSSGSVSSTTELKSSDSQNSGSDSSPTFTQTTLTMSERTPTLFSPNQTFDPPLSDIGDQNAFSEMGTFGSFITTCSDQIPLGFVDEIEHSRPSSHDGVTAAVAAEDWGLFDQSNWVNNYDHQSNHFP